MASEMDATNRWLLSPGHIHYASGAEVIQMVLGSAVSVCLWDQDLLAGAANHFRYPRAPSPKQATAMYGDAAILQLLRLMRDHGSAKSSLVAHIYGGAYPEHGRGRDIGAENATVAREILAKLAVPVISEDLGGSMGRKLIFEAGTGHAGILKVHNLRGTDWAPEIWKE